MLFFPYNSNKPRSQRESCLFSTSVSGLASNPPQLPTVATTSSSCNNLWQLSRIHFPEIVSKCQTGKLIPSHWSLPLWNFSSRNRFTPVSIQDGVYHGITFAAISTIPATPSPISAELSPISVDRRAPMRRRRSLRDSLNIIKHC